MQVSYVDHNGLNDVVIASSGVSGGADTIAVYLNQGKRNFANALTWTAAGSINGFEVGDLNGDELPDLVVAGASNVISVALGTGNGKFSLPVNYPVNVNISRIRLGDLDGDGSLDVVVGSNSDGVVCVPRGNSDGSFGHESDYSIAGADCQALAIDDVNGDGIWTLSQ